MNDKFQNTISICKSVECDKFEIEITPKKQCLSGAKKREYDKKMHVHGY